MCKRIYRLQDSPCYKCKMQKKCDSKISKSPRLSEVKDAVFGKADFDFHKCGIYVSLNAPELVEVEEKTLDK